MGVYERILVSRVGVAKTRHRVLSDRQAEVASGMAEGKVKMWVLVEIVLRDLRVVGNQVLGGERPIGSVGIIVFTILDCVRVFWR